jgi:hypothetical protein
VGLYKLCQHKGRTRDCCDHAWWARFRHVRVSLSKWANREIENKTQAGEAFDELKKAVREGTFDRRGLEPPADFSPLTVQQFVAIYKARHVNRQEALERREDRLQLPASARSLR